MFRSRAEFVADDGGFQRELVGARRAVVTGKAAWFSAIAAAAAIVSCNPSVARAQAIDVAAELAWQAWQHREALRTKTVRTSTGRIKLPPGSFTTVGEGFPLGDAVGPASDIVGAPKADDGVARCKLGRALMDEGKVDEAIAALREALRIEPANIEVHKCLGEALASRGKLEEAAAEFSEAARLEPVPPASLLAEASSFARDGRMHVMREQYDEAIADFNAVIRISPNAADGYSGRGIALVYKLEYDKAIADFADAIRRAPHQAWSYVLRGWAWSLKGEYRNAIADCEVAVRKEPRSSFALWQLSWLLATCPDAHFRDGTRAIQLAAKACELSQWKNATCIATLAAGYADSGDFDQAVKFQIKAMGLSLDEKQRTEYRSRLELYRQRKPYREAPE